MFATSRPHYPSMLLLFKPSMPSAQTPEPTDGDDGKGQAAKNSERRQTLERTDTGGVGVGAVHGGRCALEIENRPCSH